MQPPETKDPLDALLLENEPYIDDAGFTARVMASLPPRRRYWLRPVILFGSILFGLALLIWWLPSLKDDVLAGADEGVALNLGVQSLLTMGILCVSAVALTWGLFAAVRSED